jgi:hypothetical protein
VVYMGDNGKITDILHRIHVVQNEGIAQTCFKENPAKVSRFSQRANSSRF